MSRITKTQELINERATDAQIRKELIKNIDTASNRLDELCRKLELATFSQHVEAGWDHLDAPVNYTIERLEQGERTIHTLIRKISELNGAPNPDLVRILGAEINLELIHRQSKN